MYVYNTRACEIRGSEKVYAHGVIPWQVRPVLKIVDSRMKFSGAAGMKRVAFPFVGKDKTIDSSQ